MKKIGNSNADSGSHLWRELETSTTSPSRHGTIKKLQNPTFSDFLRDLHIQTKISSESDVMEIIDLSGHSFSLSSRQKNQLLNMKSLIENFRNILFQIKEFFSNFKVFQQKQLENKFGQFVRKNDLIERQKNLRIRELQFQIKNLNIKVETLEKQNNKSMMQNRQKLLKEQNNQLLNYLKDLNKIVLSINQRNCVLEEKLDKVKDFDNEESFMQTTNYNRLRIKKSYEKDRMERQNVRLETLKEREERAGIHSPKMFRKFERTQIKQLKRAMEEYYIKSTLRSSKSAEFKNNIENRKVTLEILVKTHRGIKELQQ